MIRSRRTTDAKGSDTVGVLIVRTGGGKMLPDVVREFSFSVFVVLYTVGLINEAGFGIRLQH